MSTALKSTSVTYADGIQSELSSNFNDKVIIGGYVKDIVETVEITTSQNVNSIIRMCRVHSSWCILWIYFQTDVITSLTPHVGLYQTTENGGAAADLDCYATSLATSSATPVSNVNQRFEAATTGDIALIKNKVWQDAGATSDTNRFYDLCLTSTGTPGGAGTCSLHVLYTDGN